MEDEGIAFVLADLKKDFGAIGRCGIELVHPWLVAEDCHADSSVVLEGLQELGMRGGDYIIFEDIHENTPNDLNVSAENMDQYKYVRELCNFEVCVNGQSPRKIWW